MGKTQLVTEYAYRYAGEYEVVWWLRAEEPATLASDYNLLARELVLPESSATDQSAIVRAVQRWLRQQQRWLLVFDNTLDPSAPSSYLPQGGGGHVFITSRNPGFGSLARQVSVQPLTLEEATQFILRRTGQLDETSAADLAAALGELPLALEQAAAYIKTTGRSLSEFLQLFRQRQGELLRRGPPPVDYSATVATTWELAFQEVQKASPRAVDLLYLCAFLAPDNIPRDLLGDRRGRLPRSLTRSVADPVRFDEIIGILQRYSLIEARGSVLSIHRLV